jgi:hypothetical protein
MRRKDSLFLIIGLLILGLPLYVLLAAGVNEMRQPTEPTPTASPELRSACQYHSPDGRFCAGELDFGGVMVQADDGRFLYASLWKWNDFIGWTPDSRYALFENGDQYGNNFAVLLDTELWEVWRPGRESTCTLGMSGQCQQGFVLVTANWLLQGNGTYIDLANRTEKSLFAEEGNGFIWLANLSPDKSKIAFLGAEQMAKEGPGGTPVSLYIANADGTNVTIVPDLTFSVWDIYPPELIWQADSQHIYFDIENQTYTYNITTGEWETQP